MITHKNAIILYANVRIDACIHHYVGPADSELLYDPPNKEDVTQLLYMVTDWYSVGLKLGLPTDELDEIRYGGGPREQKKLLAGVWLEAVRRKGEEPTWQRLLAVLAELKMIRAVESINKRYSECQWHFRSSLVWISSLWSFMYS